MDNNLHKRLIASGLAVVLLVLCAIFVFFPKEAEEETVPEIPDIVIGVGKINGVFLPFFEASDGDADVRETVLSRLAYPESDTTLTASEGVPSIAENIDIFYADKDFGRTDEYSGAYTAVRYILKNGAVFSDGTPITSVDAAFSLYTLIDPMSKGDRSGFETLAGYDDYAEGIKGVTELSERAKTVIMNDTGAFPTDGDGYTAAEAAFMRSALAESGTEYANRIKSFVLSKYLDEALVSSNIFDGISPADVVEDEALSSAYTLRMWNYGTFLYDYSADDEGKYVGVADAAGKITMRTTYSAAMKDETYVEYVQSEDGKYTQNLMTGAYVRIESGDEPAVRYSRVLAQKYVRISRTALTGFRDPEGVTYTLKGEDYPSMMRFFELMKANYTSDGIFDFEAMENIESADEYSFSKGAALAFAKNYCEKEAVTGISGIQTGLVEYNGEERECLTLYFEGNDYNAAYYSNFFVVSKNSCLVGYDTTGELINDAGGPVSSEKFFTHLKNISSNPVSAGPYTVVEYDGVTLKLTANENFTTLGAGVPSTRVEKLYVRDISNENTAKLLNNGEITLSTVSVTKDEIDAMNSDVVAKYYPNSTYKYIMINPAYCRNLYARRAISSTLNPALIYSDTERPISRVVPTYFDTYAGAYEYNYDESGETASVLFKAAGYTQNDEGGLIDPSTREVASFKFYMLPEESDGSCEAMISNSVAILRSLGANAEIVYDADLKNRVFTDASASIYVLGWDVGHELSLFERYAVSSETDAVRACGLKKLLIVGQSDVSGTLTYTTLEGGTVTTNQAAAVTELDRLITHGTSSIDRDERITDLTRAEELITELCFEIPLCEYEDVILVRRDIIAQSSIGKDASGSKNPLCDIWKLRYAKAYSETEET